MKIKFTESCELLDLGRRVNRGDEMDSSAEIPESLLRAYVRNGMATEISNGAGPRTSNIEPALEGESHVS